MSEQPMTPGKQYWAKHTTLRTSAEVQDVRYSIDVNSLHRLSSANLKLNEVGRCHVAFHDPIMFDAYRRNRHTGSFILVDRISNETVAAGMLLDPDTESSDREHWDDEPLGMELRRAESRISNAEREAQFGHKPFTLLITGLSGSGKTTLALDLEKQLFEQGRKCVVLDGQNMRFGLSRDLGFSAEERSENVRRAAEVSKTLNEAGLISVAAFVAPHAEVRHRVRELIGTDQFVHIHLSTPIETCRRRDPTGRYLAADRGDIANFPGVTSPYDLPNDADLTINLETTDRDAAVSLALELLAGKQFWNSES
jgi:bifunctional enzyme CysN/CysC